MQKVILFAVRDGKGETYGTPFVKASRGEAERTFTQLRRDKSTVVAQFPEDFDLFEIGEYEADTGKVTGYDSPRHMCKAIDISAE